MLVVVALLTMTSAPPSATTAVNGDHLLDVVGFQVVVPSLYIVTWVVLGPKGSNNVEVLVVMVEVLLVVVRVLVMLLVLVVEVLVVAVDVPVVAMAIDLFVSEGPLIGAREELSLTEVGPFSVVVTLAPVLPTAMRSPLLATEPCSCSSHPDCAAVCGGAFWQPHCLCWLVEPARAETAHQPHLHWQRPRPKDRLHPFCPFAQGRAQTASP
jgi:hypothetical protein